MVKHKVNIQHDEDEAPEIADERVIKQAALASLFNEAVDIKCVVNVLITDDKGIRDFNRDYREIDSATDVLSFPMQTFQKAGWGGICDVEIDEDTGDLPLGDIIISMESVNRQANEYENSVEYETAYLIIHSTLHLLGYDHDSEDSEKKMHEKGKSIMKGLSFDT